MPFRYPRSMEKMNELSYNPGKYENIIFLSLALNKIFKILRQIFKVANCHSIAHIKKGLFFIGALSALGWAPYHIMIAPIFSFNLLVVRTWFCRNIKEAFQCGWWWGWGFYMASLFWAGNSLWVDAAKFAWLWPFSILCLPALFALYPALALVIIVYIKRFFTHGAYGIIFIFVWSLLEFLQGHLFTGFPWNLLAYSWGNILPMAQWVSLLGSYGMGILTLTLFIMPALFFLFRQSLLKGCAMSVLGCIVCYGIGYYRLTLTPTSFYPNIYLRLVQAAIPQHEKGKYIYANKHWKILKKLSNLPSSQKLTHIIWYEGAIPWCLSPDILPVFSSIHETAVLLTGCVYRENAQKIFNALMASIPLRPAQLLYAKSHLLPFGEYIPFRLFLEHFVPAHWLKKITPGATDFSPGPTQHVLSYAGLPCFRPLICYESIFPGSIRPSPEKDQPLWILNITNDGWFGNSPGPYQHFESAKFRAIEEGLPLVRVANTGISAIIDPLGRTLCKLALNAQGVIDSPLPRPLKRTLYSQFHEKIWCAMMVSLLLFACVINHFQKKRIARSA
jgi:apolipoprotein N-acyltransferase